MNKKVANRRTEICAKNKNVSADISAIYRTPCSIHNDDTKLSSETCQCK